MKLSFNRSSVENINSGSIIIIVIIIIFITRVSQIFFEIEDIERSGLKIKDPDCRLNEKMKYNCSRRKIKKLLN